MKRFLSILSVFVLIFAFSIPSFAYDSKDVRKIFNGDLVLESTDKSYRFYTNIIDSLAKKEPVLIGFSGDTWYITFGSVLTYDSSTSKLTSTNSYVFKLNSDGSFTTTTGISSLTNPFMTPFIANYDLYDTHTDGTFFLPKVESVVYPALVLPQVLTQNLTLIIPVAVGAMIILVVSSILLPRFLRRFSQN